jgi:hypothetical protein
LNEYSSTSMYPIVSDGKQGRSETNLILPGIIKKRKKLLDTT